MGDCGRRLWAVVVGDCGRRPWVTVGGGCGWGGQRRDTVCCVPGAIVQCVQCSPALSHAAGVVGARPATGDASAGFRSLLALPWSGGRPTGLRPLNANQSVHLAEFSAADWQQWPPRYAAVGQMFMASERRRALSA